MRSTDTMESASAPKDTLQTGLDLAALFAPIAGAVTYLGPAQVVAIDMESASVRLSTGIDARAVFAFALPYEPSLGDVLLVIGGSSGHYAIGVLQGKGRVSLEVSGDIDVRAVGGKLRLAGDEGVEIAGKAFEVLVDKVKITAGDVVNKCATLYQRVSVLFSAHHKEAHTVVDEESFTRAKRAAVLTEETMTINGKQIHLG